MRTHQMTRTTIHDQWAFSHWITVGALTVVTGTLGLGAGHGMLPSRVAPLPAVVLPLAADEYVPHLTITSPRDALPPGIVSTTAYWPRLMLLGTDTFGIRPLTQSPLQPARRTQPFATTVADAAARYELDPRLLHAMILVESGNRVTARSPRGALGLMQLMPTTLAAYDVRDPFDAAQNIDAGAQHLAALIQRFGTVEGLAAYNAGAGAVQKYGGIPPYPETHRYVRRVLCLFDATRTDC